MAAGASCRSSGRSPTGLLRRRTPSWMSSGCADLRMKHLRGVSAPQVVVFQNQRKAVLPVSLRRKNPLVDAFMCADLRNKFSRSRCCRRRYCCRCWKITSRLCPAPGVKTACSIPRVMSITEEVLTRSPKTLTAAIATSACSSNGPQSLLRVRTRLCHNLSPQSSFVACAVQAHGRDWDRLAAALPGKTRTQIKSYYQNYKTRLGLEALCPPSEGALLFAISLLLSDLQFCCSPAMPGCAPPSQTPVRLRGKGTRLLCYLCTSIAQLRQHGGKLQTCRPAAAAGASLCGLSDAGADARVPYRRA